MEMSFVEQEDVFQTIEPVLKGIFHEFGNGRTVDEVWPRISYRRCRRSGTAPTSPICATR